MKDNNNISKIDSYQNLDILRSFAIISVIFAHLWRFFGDVIVFKKIEISHNFGLLGVILFFVHTSLVLMFSLDRQKQQFALKYFCINFWIRRILRIYPLSIIIVFIIFIFNIPVSTLHSYHFTANSLNNLQIAANFLLIQNIFPNNTNIMGPLWSLPIEIQIYLLLPFIFLFVNKHNSLISNIILWLIITILVLITYPYLNKFNSNQNNFIIPELWRWIPCFLPGIIAYQLWKIKKNIFPFITFPLLLIFVSFIFFFSYKDFMNYICCGLVGIILPFIKESPLIFINKISAKIAQYSYGLYLLHIPCMWLSFIYFSNIPIYLQTIIFIFILVFSSIFFFHFLENPMINFGKKLINIINTKQTKKKIPIAPSFG